jgi:CxxC motif-containing protein (DUF1111 family)
MTGGFAARDPNIQRGGPHGPLAPVVVSRKAAFPLGFAAIVCLCIVEAKIASALDASPARDPGVRTSPGTSDPLANATPTQLQLFRLGKAEFAEAEGVADGLGPTMNLDSCGGCHAQPALGGTSPAQNPQIALARFAKRPANMLPSFVSSMGPVRVARFVKNPDGTPDGTVHALFTIADRPDAEGCVLAAPDFATELARQNVIYRIPTPVFGGGLIEQIPDSAILANQTVSAAQNKALGVAGRPNRVVSAAAPSPMPSAGEGKIAIGRFGWKAQNSSLLVAGAEAYNQEMGITNEIFQTERSQSATCPYVTQSKDAPDDDPLLNVDVVRRYRNTMGHRYPLDLAELRRRLASFAARNPPGRYDLTHTDDAELIESASSIEKFAIFMRFLAPPNPSPDTPGGAQSISTGKSLFGEVGCATCHTPTLYTRADTDSALRSQPVNLYSDLLVHDMGSGLADGVTQAQAGPRDFRTAPLWGLGQRLYFLHDGRTSDLLVAVKSHQSGSAAVGDASEANKVVDNFNRLPESAKQDILNFLRSL